MPERSIHFWSGPAKVITPEVAYAGRGSRKLFSSRNFVQIRVTYLLTQRWIALETIRALMQAAKKAVVTNGRDWFQLPAQPDVGRVEMLTCIRARDWKWWLWGPTTSLQHHAGERLDLPASLPNESANRMRYIEVDEVDWPRRQAMTGSPQSVTPPTAREGNPEPLLAMLQELENHEDAIVVNLTRVKRGILGRLKL